MLFAQVEVPVSAPVIPGEFTFTALWWLGIYVAMVIAWAVTSTRTTMDARRSFGRSATVRWVSAVIGLLVFVGIPTTLPRLLLPSAVLLAFVPVVYSIFRVYRRGGVGVMRAVRDGTKHTVILAYSVSVRLLTVAAELAWMLLQALLRLDWETLRNFSEMTRRAGDRVQQIVSPGSFRDFVILQESGIPLDVEADPRLKTFPKSVIPKVIYLLQQGMNLQAADTILSVQGQGQVESQFRVDGILHNGPAMSREEGVLVARAIKMIAGLPASGAVAAREGSFPVMYGGQRSDVFVEVAPSQGGEAIVLRNTAEERVTIEKGLSGLGIDDAAMAVVGKLISQKAGLLLVAGRVDSGKSTTIHAAIREVGLLGKTVASVEKSMRHRLEHITQIRAGTAGAPNFPTAIDAAIRQHPDVLVVRDIFDRETAEICLREASSGRLVIAGFHADDVADALQRLLSLGVNPGLMSLAITGITAQRLARVLCPSCKTAYQPTPELAAKLGIPMTDSLRFQRTAGCPKCRGTGFQGRTGIFELLQINEVIKSMLTSDASIQNSRQTIRGALTRSLRQSAIAKVYHGVTSVEEVARVLK
jgi:type II secretory ATPase GspE/PulE/Tfp pilus assembly ATPase PilB-like protein